MTAKIQRLPVDRVVHCDWSTDAAKRWLAQADWNGESYVVGVPRPVGDLSTFIPSARKELVGGAKVIVGFDFPIGVPAAYASRVGVTGFLELLPLLGTGPWAEFYDVCETRQQISLHRPFYPYRPGGTSPDHLVQALGLEHKGELLRTCELHRQSGKKGSTGGSGRNAASPLFWTLGGKQVGRAAISGWRDLLAPVTRSDPGVGFWPFQGELQELLSDFPTVLAETYPAEAYGHLGLPRSGWSKRSQPCRRGLAPTLRGWADRSGVVVDHRLRTLVDDGFGPRADGEDPFDAVVGLFSMIEVALGIRREGTPDEDYGAIEGWILGQESENPPRSSPNNGGGALPAGSRILHSLRATSRQKFARCLTFQESSGTSPA